jgi:ABC-2 type transport system ATP-binding protein
MSINTSNRIAAIETHRLTKSYGQARGVIDLDMRVEVGEIFGFLGPNGAGKTTTIRTLLDFIRPSSGSATILGLDVHRQSIQIKKRLGNLPGELALYSNLTGWQVLEYSANLRGGVDRRDITSLAERLDADLSRPMKAYSHGNKQKIGLIQAMMHKPELVMLDEPTTGLDPLVQQNLYEILEEVKQEGRTVFFSSHVLPEVERLCDRVAIVREGRLVAVETIAGLKEKAVRVLEVVFDRPMISSEFAAVPGVEEVTAHGSVLSFKVKGSMDALVKAVAQHTVINVVAHEQSLEEIFLGFYKARESAGEGDHER